MDLSYIEQRERMQAFVDFWQALDKERGTHVGFAELGALPRSPDRARGAEAVPGACSIRGRPRVRRPEVLNQLHEDLVEILDEVTGITRNKRRHSREGLARLKALHAEAVQIRAMIRHLQRKDP